MIKTPDLTPLQRQALLAALTSPQQQFNRTRAGYAPANTEAADPPAFTYRLMRMMERDYLVAFDDPAFPSCATLTKPGLALAEQLRDATLAKVGTSTPSRAGVA